MWKQKKCIQNKFILFFKTLIFVSFCNSEMARNFLHATYLFLINRRFQWHVPFCLIFVIYWIIYSILFCLNHPLKFKLLICSSWKVLTFMDKFIVSLHKKINVKLYLIKINKASMNYILSLLKFYIVSLSVILNSIIKILDQCISASFFYIIFYSCHASFNK